jgi:hypothetical protein
MVACVGWSNVGIGDVGFESVYSASDVRSLCILISRTSVAGNICSCKHAEVRLRALSSRGLRKDLNSEKNFPT